MSNNNDYDPRTEEDEDAQELNEEESTLTHTYLSFSRLGYRVVRQ